MKTFSWKLGIVAAVVLIAAVYVLPTFVPGAWPHTRINLGLDLQGGMHLVLEVDTDKAVEGAVERLAQELRDTLRAERVRVDTLERVEDRRIDIRVPADSVEDFERIFDDRFRNLRVLSRDRIDGALALRVDLSPAEAEEIRRLATAQALETIRNRIDQFGVSEPDIRRQGERRILIQLPGVDDTRRAKDLIGRTAQLEFKLLDEDNDPRTAEETGTVPAGSDLLYQVQTDPETNREIRTPYLVRSRSLLTGANLTDARVQIDSQFNEPYVRINFDRKGGRVFEQITGENVRKRLAIVLDDRVHSAPVIQERISGGEARITGSFTMNEATDLAIVLRAGALPAPVDILEERTVGPSLGADSIRQGLFSMIAGGILVIVFMAVYYRMAGLVADLALVLNMLLVAAGLAAFGATLTLPGIAGIILTIGMAVDANVIVFERIREEINLGKTPHAAVNAGYDRATLTVLDANVTTLIAALVLFQFGTGPVKGFAVTLSLGVVSSLFTALYVTRLVFDRLLLTRRVRALSI